MNNKTQAALRNTAYLLVEITEVNTINQWVEGIDHMRAPYRIEWYTHGPVVTVPKVGDRWIITKLNNSWKLMWCYEQAFPQTRLDEMVPGDKRLEADRVILNGQIVINGAIWKYVEHVYNENPLGVKNSSNLEFKVNKAFLPQSLRYYRNGLRESLASESPSSGLFQVTIAPASGDSLIVDYDINIEYQHHGDI